MAGIKSKYGNDYNTPLSEYILTDKADISNLPTATTDAKGKFAGDPSFAAHPAIGSTCQVISSDGLEVYRLGETGWIKVNNSGCSTASKELCFKTRLEFPAVGEEDVLYIATNEESIYRFDVATTSYISLSGDGGGIANIEVIQGIL